MSKTLETNSTPGMGNTGLFEWMPFLPTLCRQCHSLTLRNHTLSYLELRKKAPDAGTSAHSLVWLGMVPQINSCVWPSNQTHTIKVNDYDHPL